jgi:hypothetical protein
MLDLESVFVHFRATLIVKFARKFCGVSVKDPVKKNIINRFSIRCKPPFVLTKNLILINSG